MTKKNSPNNSKKPERTEKIRWVPILIASLIFVFFFFGCTQPNPPANPPSQPGYSPPPEQPASPSPQPEPNPPPYSPPAPNPPY